MKNSIIKIIQINEVEILFITNDKKIYSLYSHDLAISEVVKVLNSKMNKYNEKLFIKSKKIYSQFLIQDKPFYWYKVRPVNKIFYLRYII